MEEIELRTWEELSPQEKIIKTCAKVGALAGAITLGGFVAAEMFIKTAPTIDFSSPDSVIQGIITGATSLAAGAVISAFGDFAGQELGAGIGAAAASVTTGIKKLKGNKAPEPELER